MGEHPKLKLSSFSLSMLPIMMTLVVGVPVDNSPQVLRFGKHVVGHYKVQPYKSSFIEPYNFECKASDRFHPHHKSDPIKYHICVKAGGKWKVITAACPTGANFNNEIKKCMLKLKHTQTERPVTSSTSTKRPVTSPTSTKRPVTGQTSTESLCFYSRGKLVAKNMFFGSLKSNREYIDNYDDTELKPGPICS